MKKILEVGDRVKLVNAEFVTKYLNTTGTICWISDAPYEDDTYSLTYIIDQAAEMDLRPGYTMTCSSNSVKYLKPKKDKKGKVDEKFIRKMDKLGDVTMRGTETKREQELVEALAAAVAALDVMTYMDNADKVSVLDIKKTMLAEM